MNDPVNLNVVDAGEDLSTILQFLKCAFRKNFFTKFGCQMLAEANK